MFRRQGGMSDLPFVDVQAKGRAERLVGAQGGLAPLTLVADETLRNKADSLGLFAALCAERIVSLLNDPQAGFEEAGQPFRRLQPADIAVLVRSAREADAVRREMRRRGLASVYLSDKDTVFKTREATDLLRLLQAVAAPRNVRLARAALATSLLGLRLPELLALASDDAAFDRQCDRLQQLTPGVEGAGRAGHAAPGAARFRAAGALAVGARPRGRRRTPPDECAAPGRVAAGGQRPGRRRTGPGALAAAATGRQRKRPSCTVATTWCCGWKATPTW